jgi:hypothetical protein
MGSDPALSEVIFRVRMILPPELGAKLELLFFGQRRLRHGIVSVDRHEPNAEFE